MNYEANIVLAEARGVRSGTDSRPLECGPQCMGPAGPPRLRIL